MPEGQSRTTDAGRGTAAPRVPPDAAIRLRQLRHQRGLSQRQFAALLEAPVSSLRRWERGRSAPSARAWIRALALQQGSVPVAVHPAISSNLPRPISSFVGREQELTALLPLLAGERLVTLIGPGGSGKTRLAIEAAERALPAIPHGAWLADLAPLRDAALLPQVIASALQLREQGAAPLIGTLLDFLRPRRLLLLLDNCEHLLDTCAAVTKQLLSACPGLTVLATSREALGITGEIVRTVPALALPAANTSELGVVAGSEAVQLFIARAAARPEGFRLTAENAAAVAQICRRLDGQPLAIELAAAHTSLLSPAQMAARLNGSFELLTGDDRTAPLRHRTLRAAIDWSFALLTEAERRCFRRLSAFAGSFDLEAAEAVAGPSPDMPADTPLGPEPVTMWDLLGRLTAQSLVTAVPGAVGVRFRLLETLRAYGREQLRAAGETESVLQRHAAFCLALATRADPLLDGTEQATWLLRLDLEHDDLRAALGFLAERGDGDAALWLAVSIRRFWEVRGHLSEGVGWLLRLLAAPAGISPHARARGLTAAGFLIWKQGDPKRARPLLDEGLLLWRELGDKRGIARCLLEIGASLQLQEEMEQARLYDEEALVILRELGDSLNMARLLSNLSMIACAQSRLDAALAYVQEAQQLHERVGNHHGYAIALTNLSEIVYLRGEPAEAYTHAERALAIFRSLGSERIMGAALNNMALFALALGDYDRAGADAAAALQLLEPINDQLGVASARERLALTAAHVRDDATAADQLRAALLAKRALGYPVELARGIEGAMEFAVLRGQWTRAARLFGVADALRTAAGQPLSPFLQRTLAQALEPARRAIGPAAFTAACTAGRSLGIDQAVSEALLIGAASSDAGDAGGAAVTAGHAKRHGVTPFTDRETEVLQLLASGRSNKEIAHALLMSVRTVERHVTNAYGKIGVSGRADAISYLLRHGLLNGAGLTSDRGATPAT